MSLLLVECPGIPQWNGLTFARIQTQFGRFLKCNHIPVDRDVTDPVSYTHLTLPTIYSV